MSKNRMLLVLLACITGLLLVGCTNSETEGDKTERQFTSRIQTQFNRVQPPHEYDVSQARENLIAAQDAMALGSNSWTVITIEGVGPMFECPSIGFPVPMGTQITNPEKGVDWHEASVSLPQMEPIGLYTPPNVLGTVGNCVLTNGDIGIFYAEDALTTYMFDVVFDPTTGRYGIDDAAVSSVDIIRYTPTDVNVQEVDIAEPQGE